MSWFIWCGANPHIAGLGLSIAYVPENGGALRILVGPCLFVLGYGTVENSNPNSPPSGGPPSFV